jgi:RNA recognition motif-containing protein
MNITVLNLSRDTTSAHLIKLFTTYGTVQSCEIVMDKQTGLSKGFGFIRMSNDDEANAAITSLNGKKIGGNIIRVRLVQSSNT